MESLNETKLFEFKHAADGTDESGFQFKSMIPILQQLDKLKFKFWSAVE